MKQKIAVLALILTGFAVLQTQIPPIDPSGKIAVEQAKQKNGGTLPQTGLMADPTGTAVIKAATRQQQP